MGEETKDGITPKDFYDLYTNPVMQQAIEDLKWKDDFLIKDIASQSPINEFFVQEVCIRNGRRSEISDFLSWFDELSERAKEYGN